MHIVIDIGNSRVKWAFYAQKRILSGGFSLNAELEQHLPALWRNESAVRSVAIACVGAKTVLATVRAIARSLWPNADINEVHTQKEAYGVRNAYIDAETLGVDRWLALIAARHLYPGRLMVVDCGTAITIDWMDEQGRHEGGFISPGLALMKQSLASGTEALPLDPKGYPPGPGRSTQAGIYNGTLAAAGGLIELVGRQAGISTIIMTGGDATAIAERLQIPIIIDADLVLRGLAITLDSPA